MIKKHKNGPIGAKKPAARKHKNGPIGAEKPAARKKAAS